MRRAGKLFLRVFPSIVLPMFLAIVDQTIVAAALPAIATSLGNVEQVPWVVIAYLLATTIAAPVYGQLRDVAGGRRMMFIGLAVFMSASVLCACATNIWVLILGRILQGLGGGGLMTLSQAMIGEAIPPRERARYQGYLAAVAVTSSMFGPIAGGYLTEHFGWRSIFLINLPLGAIALFMTYRLKARPVAQHQQEWAFDWLGLMYFVLFVVPVLMALNQLQKVTTSSALLSFGLLTAGVAALVFLLRHESRARFPLMPVTLLRQAVIWRCDALAACHGAVMVSLVTLIPIYCRVVRGMKASEMGLLLLPLVISIGIGSMITGRLISMTGRTAIFPSIGLIPVAIGILVFGFFAANLGPYQMFTLLFALGLFMGTVMGVVQVTVQQAAGAQRLGAAAASVQFSRSVGAAVGTALTAMVLFGAVALLDPQAASLFPRLVETGPAILRDLPLDRQLAVAADIAVAFKSAFAAIAAFSMIGIALAWSIPVRRL